MKEILEIRLIPYPENILNYKNINTNFREKNYFL